MSTDDPRGPQGPTGDSRIRTDVAHNARVWNHWLGGKDNYPVDRAVGDHVTGLFPSIGEVARADREFLGRAVTFLAAEAGIRQFLDIGTGLPTADNTHEVAQRVAPDSRIVYVDNDPIVLTHARALLTSSPEGRTEYLDADAHDPAAIVRSLRPTLDPGRPIAVIMLGILNFVLDTDVARAVVRTLMDAVPSGSYLVLTHPTTELGGEANAEAMAFWNENATPPITARPGAEIASFFAGLELLEPGLVSCSRWRPAAGDTEPRVVAQYGAVARKP
ncbi:SAM-dependent methyltransferase [Streptomyces sp. NPDC058953]|uniref:SAM-dependent methyltransferase n=1 Tax=unclassified Streptomyces TaxID=2593676 RepID=UPI0036A1D02D